MQRHAFNYELPADLIAQSPVSPRSGSRLLVLDGHGGRIQDHLFTDFPEMLRPGDILVFNDTRVVPARLVGRKASGGQVEMLLERLVDVTRARVQLRASKKPQPGTLIYINDVHAQVIGREGDFFELDFSPHGARVVFDRYGSLPLPPYITRRPDAHDSQRYQTVFARCDGAVAAPTAGLHFDESIFTHLAARGIDTVFVTLHVGAGTFQPVRVEDVAAHRMHQEWFEVTAEVCAQISHARASGGRVIAVGTTVVRALESASLSGKIAPFRGETDIFIVPGHRFAAVDGLVTNFHIPESTLLMLVCAFGGYEQVMKAYTHAVQARYRFFSYGDAMLVWPHPHASRERGGSAR